MKKGQIMFPLLKALSWHPHLIRMKCKLLFWASSPFPSLSISHLLFQPLSPLLSVLQILHSDFVLSVHQTCPTLLSPGLLDVPSSLCFPLPSRGWGDPAPRTFSQEEDAPFQRRAGGARGSRATAAGAWGSVVHPAAAAGIRGHAR